MIIDKSFEVVINLTNINDIFSNSLDLVVFNKIKDTYEKRCFKSCFILKINNIVERGMLNINKRSLTCETSMDVKFSAKVVLYEYLEIINNNVIENITKSRIECRTSNSKNDETTSLTHNTVSYINISNQDMSSLKIGQIIPIRVGKATYQPMQSTISVNAFPFIPIGDDDTYYKIDELNDDEKALLNSTIMVDIVEVKEQLRTVSKDRLKFFKSLLYPYKKNTDSSKSVLRSTVIDLLSLTANGIICQSYRSDLFDHQLIIDKTNENPIPESALTIYKIYLNNYLKYIKNILEMCIIYKDDEIFDDHQNVFDIYNKFKLN